MLGEVESRLGELVLTTEDYDGTIALIVAHMEPLSQQLAGLLEGSRNDDAPVVVEHLAQLVACLNGALVHLPLARGAARRMLA